MRNDSVVRRAIAVAAGAALACWGCGPSDDEVEEYSGPQAVSEAVQGLASPTDVLRYHNDGFNDGQYLAETVLTPGNVRIGFGKRFSVAVNGAIVAQPLFVSGLNVTTGTSPGVHDVVVVATLSNTLYAIDADNGEVLWRRSLLHSFHGGTPGLRAFVGVTATPAIDPASNVLYAESYQVENGNTIHVLSAIQLANGAYFARPVNIAEGTSSSAYISGPSAASGAKFDAYDLTSRSLALDSVNRTVYMAYGDPGDVGPYNGWVIGYSADTDASGNLIPRAVWCATPNGHAGGIWQGGGGIAVDDSGNLFVITGNGTFDTTLAVPRYVANGRLTSLTDNANYAGGLETPQLGDYGDSVVKLAPDGDRSQRSDNPNGFGLHVSDYFTPKDEAVLAANDLDLGSSSSVLLPASVGSTAHKQLLFMDDKQGIVYLIDRNAMGLYHGDGNGMGSGTNDVVQELDEATSGAWSTGAFYAAGSTNSGTIYLAAQSDVAKAFRISGARITPTPTSTSASSYGSYSYPGSTPEVSADGASNGVLWTLDKSKNILIAYAASNLGTLLFRSDHGAGNGLTGSIETFHTPTVAKGHVFVGTSGALNAYGR
jgi:hypothetical protein